MFKSLFNRKTTKMDVLMAGVAAIAASWKAIDTYKDYKSDSAQENTK